IIRYNSLDYRGYKKDIFFNFESLSRNLRLILSTPLKITLRIISYINKEYKRTTILDKVEIH
ncbi:uncharacterized protein N7525_005232, partial [Penicillium rubens]|uniref:uncharacterized protein n=1 Tax=Penicillium rubens TaxID=1108849 RepID=UPI002A5B112E